MTLFFTASIQAVGKGSAKPITRDGVEYLQADKIITKIRVGNAQIAVEDATAGIAGEHWHMRSLNIDNRSAKLKNIPLSRFGHVKMSDRL